MMSGALTSTPGLAAALDATGSANASIGYGIAYPFGVVGVVLFVQLVPKILKTDMAAERAKFEAAQNVSDVQKKDNLFHVDSMGFFAFALAIALGIILAKIVIPLPGGAQFSLGTSGGPLIAGLILGHFGHAGKISFHVEKSVLECLREFGLALFLIGAGVEAGSGFIEILKEHGLILFVYGALITLIPMIVGYFVATKLMKLSLFNTLGSICGGMTSTPALGTLIRVPEQTMWHLLTPQPIRWHSYLSYWPASLSESSYKQSGRTKLLYLFVMDRADAEVSSRFMQNIKKMKCK